MAAPNQQRRFNRSQSPNLSRPAANAHSHSMHRQQQQHTVKTLDRTLNPDGHKQGGDVHVGDMHKQQQHKASWEQTLAADRSRGSKPALGYAVALNHKQNNSYARMHVPEQAVETQLGNEEDRELKIPVNRHVTMQHQQARFPSRSAQPLSASNASCMSTLVGRVCIVASDNSIHCVCQDAQQDFPAVVAWCAAGQCIAKVVASSEALCQQ